MDYHHDWAFLLAFRARGRSGIRGRLTMLTRGAAFETAELREKLLMIDQRRTIAIDVALRSARRFVLDAVFAEGAHGAILPHTDHPSRM